MKKAVRGFTLIEIMIVVAVIGILAAIAIPSYNSQLRKGRRADAQAFMMTVAQRQAAYLLDARSYAIDPNALTTLGVTPPTSFSDFYDLTVAPGPTNPSYVITARPIATKPQSVDGPMTLTSEGLKERVDPKNGKAPW